MGPSACQSHPGPSDRRTTSGTALVSESVDRFVWVLANLLVGLLEPDPHDPGSASSCKGEGRRRAESDGVAWGVRVHP
jgi:hypothetical protein